MIRAMTARRRPERQRPRVAHEDLGRVDVEPEEPEQGADDQGAEEGQVRLGRDVQEADDQERDEGEHERPAGEPVEAVGDVHAVARGDDREGREEDVEHRVDVDRADERDRDLVDLVGPLDQERGGEGEDDLPEQLLADADPLPRLRVQVVVERAERSDARERPERGVDAALGRPAQEQVEDDHDDDQQGAAHRRGAVLDLVAVRPLDPDLLREPGRAQQADVRRHQDHDDREGEEQALDQLDLHRAGVSGPPSAATRSSTRRSRATPRDALTRTTSPAARSRRRTSRASARSATVETAAASSPAAIAPAAIPRAPSPTTTRRSTIGSSGFAGLAMAALVLGAQLEHLAEDRDPPARQPGDQLEGGGDRAGRGVVGVVDDRHAAGPDDLRPVRRAPADGERLHDHLEREPGRPTGRRGGQRVVDGHPAERRDRDGSPLPVRDQLEGHPVRAARPDRLRAHVGVGREPVGHGLRTGPRRHPRGPARRPR